MTHAYNELYVSSAQSTLAAMLDHARYDLGWDIHTFYHAFINSGIAHRFGMGEPKYIVGMSGIELAREVVKCVTGIWPDSRTAFRSDRTPEYWAGWSLAYYEWYKNISFEKIEKRIPITEIVEMYHPYHEADITRFVYEIDLRMEKTCNESMLARLRAYAGYTQKALAERSGVSVRMIEQYEQGKKDISHAGVETVYKLARALNCKVEDLI